MRAQTTRNAWLGGALILIGLATIPALAHWLKRERSSSPTETLNPGSALQLNTEDESAVAPFPFTASAKSKPNRADATATVQSTGRLRAPLLGENSSTRATRPTRSPKSQEVGLISGWVGTPSGNGLGGVLVSAAPRPRTRGVRKIWSRTSPEGAFELEVPRLPGILFDVQIAATSRNRALRSLIRTLQQQGQLLYEDIAPDTEQLLFQVPLPGQLDLLCIDAHTGLGLESITVSWKGRLPGSYSEGSEGSISSESNEDAATRGGGRFRTKSGRIQLDLPVGDVELTLSSRAYTQVVRSFAVTATCPTPIPIPMESMAEVRILFSVEEGLQPRELWSGARQFNRRPGEFLLYGGKPFLLPEADLKHLNDFGKYSNPQMVAASLGLPDGVSLKASKEDFTHRGFAAPGTYWIGAFPQWASFTPAKITIPPGRTRHSGPLHFDVRVSKAEGKRLIDVKALAELGYVEQASQDD